MSKSQLYRKKPPKELIVEIVKYFGFSGLDDKRHFTRKDLDSRLVGNTISLE